MALLGCFIGVDQHLAPDYNELTGAVRDATALWALFTDTFPGARIQRLTNREATAEQMRYALAMTLDAAGPGDQVVVSFAGHGTSDGRLVPYDADPKKIEATTISMAEIAEKFRACKADTVLCVLDCCFSGTAPARVIEGPTQRGAVDLAATFAGKGKVLIAASSSDQPAYEHPTHRHGLLTRALVEVLTAGEERIDLTKAMARVLELVQADAAAIGRIQTPVLTDHVEGGFTMPPLKRGDQFIASFPEAAPIRVTARIADLAAAGIPAPIITEWSSRYPDGLNDLQLKAINEFGILSGRSLFVVAPTSAGKTFVGEIASLKALVQGRKAVFLLPYKALVNEKYDQFVESYREKLGLRVVRCTGDHGDQVPAFLRGRYDLAVLTYEMFLALAIGNPGVLDRIGLVALDEAQFISDGSRGIIVELILTALKDLQQREIAPQLIALSATVGDMNYFDRWLSIPTLVWTARPVPLEFGVLDRDGIFEYVDKDGKPATRQLLPRSSIQQRRQKPGSQDVIVPLVQQILADKVAKERVIIFRNKKGSAQGCAKYLAEDLGLPSATDVIDALPPHDTSTASADLRDALAGGTSFHNANLNREERALVERAFRQVNGNVHVLTATTTVAAGINTPASTVIIAENELPARRGPFSVGEIRNMAGRAGRVGYRETGRAILLADTPYERHQLFQKYVLGQSEPMRSSFSAGNIGTWILRLLAQLESVPCGELVNILVNTFGGYLASLREPGWRDRTKATIEGLLPRMTAAGMLEPITDRVRLTMLGRACGQSSLSFDSCLNLLEGLRSERGAVTPEELMGLIQGLVELDNVYTPIANGPKDAQWPDELRSRGHHTLADALRSGARDTTAYSARTKRACILLDWIAGTAMEEIERGYTMNLFLPVGAGEVRGIAEGTRFHLNSAYLLASAAMGEGKPKAEDMELLLKRLEFGITSDLIPLLGLPLPLARGEYRALGEAGLRTTEQVWAAQADRLKQILGGPRTAQLLALKPGV